MEFKKIGETEILTEVPEGASVLGIVNGAVKQMPTDGMGGGKTLIIVQDSESSATANMSLDEAMSALRNRELQGAVLYVNIEGAAPCLVICCITDASEYFNQECLVIECINPSGGYSLFWTVDGISSEQPGDVS